MSSQKITLEDKILSDSERIYPILVGTLQPGGPGGYSLHAEGIVLFRNYYLLADRSCKKPGIAFFEITDLEKFTSENQDFFNRAIVSISGGKGSALTNEQYYEPTSSEGIHSLHKYIEMSHQNQFNCTMASSEAIFMGTLYCALIKQGFEAEEAIVLAKKYGGSVLQQNKNIEVDFRLSRILQKNVDTPVEILNELYIYFQKLGEGFRKLGLDQRRYQEFVIELRARMAGSGDVSWEMLSQYRSAVGDSVALASSSSLASSVLVGSSSGAVAGSSSSLSSSPQN